MNVKVLLGKKIKRLRKLKGFTQEKFADKIDITPRNLNRIESGENFLTAETLDKIINVLNVKPSELFTVEHLKDTESLASELIEKINFLKNNPEKLEEVYKLVNAILDI